MKRLVLVSGHFAPGNLAGVHRARLWSQHLEEFGWQTTIVTTHYDYYEEKLDWDLAALVADDVRVIRTAALPTRPVRVVGDIGIRGFAWHLRALGDLARRGEMDFLHITIPSNYSALLGRLVRRRYGTPYGIDYQDPWIVADWPPARRRFSKAWFSARLARILEPVAVRDASLITGVAPLYFEQVFERHPHLRKQAVAAAMPIGGSESDHERVRALARKPFLFDPEDGKFHFFYAGTMWSPALPVLDRLFAGVAMLRERDVALATNLRFHFVGTGSLPDDTRGHQVLPVAARHGLLDVVNEHPARISYVDVLNHLQRSSANLIIGSTAPHYTPSKAFQLVQARRPLFAVLNRASTAANFLPEVNAGTVLAFDGAELPRPEEVAAALTAFVRSPAYNPDAVAWERFEEYSARSSARKLADALDRALARQQA